MYIEQLAIEMYFKKLAQWEHDQENPEREGLEPPPEKPMCLVIEEQEEEEELYANLGPVPDVLDGW